MPQVFEIKISPKLALHSRHSQQGFAILWIIAIIIAFATLGSAMVATYHVSLFGQIETGLSLRAQSLTESGYRFLFSEYQNQANDIDKNNLLDETRFVPGSTGKIFNISPDGGGQFQLEMKSYFYRVKTDPNGTTSLELKFIGNEGFTVPEAGTDSDFLRIHNDDNIYEYSDKAYDPDTKIYTFTLTSIVQQSAAEYTTVRPVVLANISSVAENGTLTLASGQGSLFPPENGMFLITKQKIKANLPVETIVPYRYKYRNGDQLINVQKGPQQSSFTTIDGGSTKIEIAKFLSVDSIGFAPDKASNLASETNTFQLSLDILASTPGLKSYWSFDNYSDAGKDDYGTSDGTLSDTGFTHTETGKVDGALEFDGTGYVTTTFNPSIKIGSNREFTIVFWAKPGSDITTEQGIVGVSKDGQDFFIGIKNKYWEWGLGSGGDECSSTGCITTLPKVKADQWQHVAFNYYFDESGNDYVNFYINGIDTGYDKEVTGTVAMPNYNIYLGALYDPDAGNIPGFTGTLDEMAIFNTTLNFCETNAIFNVADSLPCYFGCDALAYYPFNGDANDESGANNDGDPPNDNHGTEYGAVLAPDRCGFADKAYSFDGNDYIDGGDKSNLNIANEITVAAWVNHTSGDGHIVNRGGGWDDNGYSLFWLSGNIRIELQRSGEKRMLDIPAPSSGAWHHVAFTWDFGTGIITTYIDGVPAGTSSFTGPIGVPVQNLNIGRNEQHAYYFIGSIDDVIIWDKALTAQQMLDLYNGTNP